MAERLFVVESDLAGLRAALVDDRRLQAIEIDRAWRPTKVGSVTHAKVIRTVQGIGTFVRLADGTEVRSEPEAQHATQLTREHVTSAVHYITFAFDERRNSTSCSSLITAPMCRMVQMRSAIPSSTSSIGKSPAEV